MKLNPSCCRTCQKYTRQVCEARDGKCRAFEEWFIAGKIWSRAVERLRRGKTLQTKEGTCQDNGEL